MTETALYWLLPLSWVVHDLEELATLPVWRATADPWLQRFARRSAASRILVAALPSSRGSFALAAALVGGTLLAAAAAGATGSRGGLLVFSVFLGGYALHGVVHVGQAVAFGGYVPGLVTAVAVVLPTSGYLYWWLVTGGRLTPLAAVTTALVGLALFVPAVVVAGYVAARVVGADEFRSP